MEQKLKDRIKNWDIILCRGRKLTLNCGFHTDSDLTGYTRFL